MRSLVPAFLLAGGCTLPPATGRDFSGDVKEAYQTLKPVLEKCQKQINEGDLEGANAALLAVFPEATRSAAQAYLLGNLTYKKDPKLSYQLHKFATDKLPDQAEPQLEWAMEQHRAAEHAGASLAYGKYSAVHPDYAPAWGLAADCLIRQGKIKEAVAAWKSSEAAPNGSLEHFESLVCEVYGQVPLKKRETLLGALKKGDAKAGIELIVLDCNYPLDWWNVKPQKALLKNDLELLRSLKVLAGRRLEALECAVECAGDDQAPESATLESLKRHRFLIDPEMTLPEDPLLAALLVDRAVSHKAIPESRDRNKLARRIMEDARALKNPDLWNAALYLLEGVDAGPIENEAWEQTKDARFAIGYLQSRLAAKELKSDNPVLMEALRAHPERRELVSIAIRLARQERNLSEELLVQGIKAEFRHFSSTGILPRPRAALLRAYFKDLSGIAK